MSESPWPTIHSERAALAEDLAGLPLAAWSTPSLCADWTVHQVLAHMVATAAMTPAGFVAKMLSARFNFTKMSNREVAVSSAGGPEATLAAFRRVETSTCAPPGPKDSWLGETLVHAEDIRRPLGIVRRYPTSWVTRTIDFYAASNVLIGGKRRVDGLTLKAVDADWSRGSGPLVEGPAMSLLLATTGRRAGIEELSGPGVEILRSR